MLETYPYSPLVPINNLNHRQQRNIVENDVKGILDPYYWKFLDRVEHWSLRARIHAPEESFDSSLLSPVQWVIFQRW